MRTHLVAGPATHGVTRLALELSATPALRDEPVRRVAQAVGADLVAALGGADGPAPDGWVHVHVTDRLFGRSADDAADRLAALGAARPMTVTLHDLPQPSDGATAFPRRAAAYARIVAASRGVVLSSRHEDELLTDALALAGWTGPHRPRAVVPLPIDPPADRRPHPVRRPPDLALLGYLYPGKGHAQALAALRDLPADVGLVALGRPSDGHDDLVDALCAEAATLGRRFEVTGYLPDADLATRLREVAVPVAPHRHLSASGSINSWLSAGRRPLVPRGRYVDELESRCPGALFVYDDLAVACEQALAEPQLTWLDPQVRLHPTRAEAGAAYAAVLDGWAG